MHRRTSAHVRREGMTLIEIMVVTVIMAMIATAVGIQVVRVMAESKVKDARLAAITIKGIAQHFMLEHPSASCPSVEVLVEDGLLDEDMRTRDPWERPFRVECDGMRVRVTSAGPDGAFDTTDDVGGRAELN